MPETVAYPATAAARDRFVLERRGQRTAHDPWQYQGLIVEDERAPGGTIDRVATVLVTGRECPWRCAMCDLWQYTTITDTPSGAVAAQVAKARASLREATPPVTAMKLYNAGSFFDPRAVPDDDYDAVAGALRGLDRVVVESHPALVGPRLDRFLTALGPAPANGAPRLEVAMGLETAHPAALDLLNKHFTLDDFRAASRTLEARGVALRVFLLISPPFVAPDEQDDWLLRSLDAAFDCGAAIVSLVPTRGGNGTVEALAASGAFLAPTLDTIERSLTLALHHARGRGLVFADLWDLDRFSASGACPADVRDRLARMNLTQDAGA
jgi:hypothetical protein